MLIYTLKAQNCDSSCGLHPYESDPSDPSNPNAGGRGSGGFSLLSELSGCFVENGGPWCVWTGGRCGQTSSHIQDTGRAWPPSGSAGVETAHPTAKTWESEEEDVLYLSQTIWESQNYGPESLINNFTKQLMTWLCLKALTQTNIFSKPKY